MGTFRKRRAITMKIQFLISVLFFVGCTALPMPAPTIPIPTPENPKPAPIEAPKKPEYLGFFHPENVKAGKAFNVLFCGPKWGPNTFLYADGLLLGTFGTSHDCYVLNGVVLNGVGIRELSATFWGEVYKSRIEVIK
jgi:hypothetical protein